MNAKVSVIIPTMNRPQTLRKAIASLYVGTAVPDEVIVVDQSSHLEIIQEYYKVFQDAPFAIRYFHLPYPSLTCARNEGIKHAVNEIVICMDDDVIVMPETITNVQNIMASPEIALIGGYDLNTANGNSILACLFLHKSYRERNIGHIAKGIYGRYPRHREGRVVTLWAKGAFFVIRKSLVEQWELAWDEKFITYGFPEDLDFSYQYCHNARKQGLECILDSSVSVYHQVSKEWRETSRAVTMMEIINREYLTYKWGLSFWRRLFTRWANFGTFLKRLMTWNHPLDVIKAQFFCDWYRKDIRKGILHTELYRK